MYGKLYYVVKGVAAYDSVMVLITKEKKERKVRLEFGYKASNEKLTAIKMPMQSLSCNKDDRVTKICEPLERLVRHGQRLEHHNEQSHHQNPHRTRRRLE
jgi:hypothetical protein